MTPASVLFPSSRRVAGPEIVRVPWKANDAISPPSNGRFLELLQFVFFNTTQLVSIQDTALSRHLFFFF